MLIYNEVFSQNCHIYIVVKSVITYISDHKFCLQTLISWLYLKRDDKKERSTEVLS